MKAGGYNPLIEPTVGAERSAAPPMRPRDAATLIVIDRSGSAPRVLLGKRGSAHVFMPDTYVFPGGRRDRNDHALPFASDLNPLVIDKLRLERSSHASVRSVRALALAALRELREETGLVIGECRQQATAPPGDVAAHLHSLRYVARAITPPGNVRRFDTRFFCTFADEAGINPALIRDTEELHDLRWHDIADNKSLTMPRITKAILEDMKNLLNNDPALPFGSAVPFYFSRRGQFVRSSV